jgi:MAGE family
MWTCSGNVDAKSYIMVSKLPSEQYMKYVENKEASHLTGFAFVVISIIHLAGGKLAEGMHFVYVLLVCLFHGIIFKQYTMFLMCLYETFFYGKW